MSGSPARHRNGHASPAARFILAAAVLALLPFPARGEGGWKVRALVVPARETTVSSQMSGKILSMEEQVGARVPKGAMLATFDCSEVVARLKVADAEVTSAEATCAARKELLRLKSAGDTEVVLAEAALAKARAQRELAVVQVGYCEIPAPYDVTIVKVLARPFQGVTPGQNLLEVVSVGTPKVRMNLPSTHLSWLKAGVPFRFTADETRKSYEGTITHVSGRVDAVSQTIEVEGRFSGDGGDLVAGMSGYALFPRGAKGR
jgi:RND family efflux transporter MFP subunit